MGQTEKMIKKLNKQKSQGEIEDEKNSHAGKNINK